MDANHSNQSMWFVFALTTLALLAGWGFRGWLTGQTRPVEAGGVTADLPAGWVVEDSSSGSLGGDDPARAFSAWNPLSPGTTYTVRVLPGSAEVDLASVASVQNLQRAQSATAYRTLEQTYVTLHGQAGYRVTFAFVDGSEAAKAPVVVNGVDYYFASGDAVLVISLETDGALGDALGVFQDFAASVSLGE
jgi:hypothetical protein